MEHKFLEYFVCYLVFFMKGGETSTHTIYTAIPWIKDVVVLKVELFWMCVSCHLCSTLDLLIWGTKGLGLCSGEWIIKASVIRPVYAAIYSVRLSTSLFTLHQLETGLQWLNKCLSQSRWGGGGTAGQGGLGRAGGIAAVWAGTAACLCWEQGAQVLLGSQRVLLTQLLWKRCWFGNLRPTVLTA